MRIALVAGVAILALLNVQVQAAPKFSFGNDSGDYAKDGECDDPRFVGRGMTNTPLLSDDMHKDATDCRTAYEAGIIVLRGVADDGAIDFGDDNGDYANDGECDDMRFVGPGMTATALIEADIMHDASDCKSAHEAGRVQLNLK